MNRIFALLMAVILMTAFVGPVDAQEAEETPVIVDVQPGTDVIVVPDVPANPGATIEVTTPVQTIILAALAAVVVLVTVFGSLFVMALRYVYKSIPQELQPSVRDTVLSSVEYAKERVTELTNLPGDVDDELRRLIYKAVDDRLKEVFKEEDASLITERAFG